MDARKKISRGATAARLRFLSALLAVCSAALFSAFVPSAIFLRGLAGRAFAAACFLGGTGLLAWCLFFVVMLVSMMKRAGRYAFAVTESAQYECFGPFLAMNVRFFDGAGRAREGRSRFVFRDTGRGGVAERSFGNCLSARRRGGGGRRKIGKEGETGRPAQRARRRSRRRAEGENFRRKRGKVKKCAQKRLPSEKKSYIIIIDFGRSADLYRARRGAGQRIVNVS